MNNAFPPSTVRNDREGWEGELTINNVQKERDLTGQKKLARIELKIPWAGEPAILGEMTFLCKLLTSVAKWGIGGR